MNISLPMFFVCFFASKVQITFITFFFTSNDIKNVQFGYQMKENLKLFDDKVPFGDRCVYPNYNPFATKL